jgi:uncharacterized protein YecT (DUF1311 family)
MNAIKWIVLSIGLLVTTGAASGSESRTAQALRHSAPKGISEAFFGCVDKAGLDQSSIGACIKSERQRQDARLNKAYGQLMGKLDEKTKTSVKAAERAWLDFNDKSVTAETDIGGTNKVANVDVANAELFRYCERANTLEDYIFALGE